MIYVACVLGFGGTWHILMLFWSTTSQSKLSVPKLGSFPQNQVHATSSEFQTCDQTNIINSKKFILKWKYNSFRKFDLKLSFKDKDKNKLMIMINSDAPYFYVVDV